MNTIITMNAIIGTVLVVTVVALCLTVFDLLRRLPHLFFSERRQGEHSAHDVEF